MPVATWTPWVSRYSQPGEAGVERTPTSSGCWAKCETRPVAKQVRNAIAQRHAEPGGDPLVVQRAGEGALAERAGRPVGLQPLGDERDGVLGVLHVGRAATSRANQRCSASQRSATEKPAVRASGADRVDADVGPGERWLRRPAYSSWICSLVARHAGRRELDEHLAAGAQQIAQAGEQRLGCSADADVAVQQQRAAPGPGAGDAIEDRALDRRSRRAAGRRAPPPGRCRRRARGGRGGRARARGGPGRSRRRAPAPGRGRGPPRRRPSAGRASGRGRGAARCRRGGGRAAARASPASARP